MACSLNDGGANEQINISRQRHNHGYLVEQTCFIQCRYYAVVRLSEQRGIRLKKDAQKLMEQKGLDSYTAYTVDTATAFEVWHIDIKAVEKR